MTREQLLQTCRDCHYEIICAGWVLAVMELMEKAGWPIAVLAQQAKVSKSHLSEFLRLRKFLTQRLAYRLALAFDLRLWQFDQLAEAQVSSEVSL